MFLDGLGILQLLDELHFKHLHLHDLSLLLLDDLFFFSDLTGYVLSSGIYFSFSELFYLGPLQFLLVLLNLVLELTFSIKLLHLLRVPSLVLHVDEFGLLCFFPLVK